MVPGRSAATVVRTAPSPALVAAVAAARGAAQLDGAAAVDRDPAESVRLSGEPELPARQCIRRRCPAPGTSEATRLQENADLRSVGCTGGAPRRTRSRPA